MWLLIRTFRVVKKHVRAFFKIFTHTYYAFHCYVPSIFINDVRRSTQAWLQNLALFRSISSKKAKKDESI